MNFPIFIETLCILVGTDKMLGCHLYVVRTTSQLPLFALCYRVPTRMAPLVQNVLEGAEGLVCEGGDEEYLQRKEAQKIRDDKTSHHPYMHYHSE